MGTKRSINTSSLSIGKEFKNLQELSLCVLGEKLPSGKGRTLRVEQMKQYFSWKKIPNSQKIIITEIYQNKTKKLNKRSKYAPLVFDILSSYPGELCFTKTELLKVLGIVNDNFDTKKIVQNTNKLKLNYKVFKIIHTDIYTFLNQKISRALNQLQNAGYISYRKVYIAIYKDSSESEISNEIIENIYNDAKAEIHCNNYFDIIKSNLVPKYQSICDSKLSELGIKRIQNKISIQLLVKSENRPNKIELRSICKQSLLKHFHDNTDVTRIANLYIE